MKCNSVQSEAINISIIEQSQRNQFVLNTEQFFDHMNFVKLRKLQIETKL